MQLPEATFFSLYSFVDPNARSARDLIKTIMERQDLVPALRKEAEKEGVPPSQLVLKPPPVALGRGKVPLVLMRDWLSKAKNYSSIFISFL